MGRSSTEVIQRSSDNDVDIVLHTVLRERPLLRDLLDPTRVMNQRDVGLVEDGPCGIAQHMRARIQKPKQPKRPKRPKRSRAEQIDRGVL